MKYVIYNTGGPDHALRWCATLSLDETFHTEDQSTSSVEAKRFMARLALEGTKYRKYPIPPHRKEYFDQLEKELSWELNEEDFTEESDYDESESEDSVITEEWILSLTLFSFL